ncbi:MAG TPA: IPT/TIG domain-containing protein [Mycobacteriales bacterium]|nr:IPT/TIG domain-containing protein [Mycobacteriales bacterium]
MKPVIGEREDDTMGRHALVWRRLAALAATTTIVAAPLAALSTPATAASAPTVTAVTPDSGPIAGGTQITVTGTGFTGATEVDFDGPSSIPGASSFDCQQQQMASSLQKPDCSYLVPEIVSDTTLVVNAPKSPNGTQQIVDIVVWDGSPPSGSSSSTSTADQFAYLAGQVTVTGVNDTTTKNASTSSAPASGAAGDTVTITGTDLTVGGTPNVYFGTSQAKTVTANPDGTLTVNPVPAVANSNSLVDVRVQVPPVATTGEFADQGGGISPATSDDTDKFAYQPTCTPAASGSAPSVVGLNPTGGPPNASENVAVIGTGFTGATAVNFGSTSAKFTFVSDCEVIAVDPTPGSGTPDVTVATSSGTSGTSSASKFTYGATPLAVSSVTPSAVPASGGSSLTVDGTGFDSSSVVVIDGVPMGGTPSSNGNQIRVSTLSALPPGSYDVQVEDGTGATSPASSADKVAFAGLPIVSGVSPNSGPLVGGTVVTVSGSQFDGVSAVKFCSQPSPPASAVCTAGTHETTTSPTSLTIASPAETSVGVYDIEVTAAGGTSTAVTQDQFAYLAPGAATVTSVTPNYGPNSGGTPVAIIGTGFTGTTGAGGVTFCNQQASPLCQNATSYKVKSDTEIDAVAPQDPSGTVSPPDTVNIIVTNPGGASTATKADQFTYQAPQGYEALPPNRILDTRSTTNNQGIPHPVPAGTPEAVTVAGTTGVPSSGVTAVALNITAVNPSGIGNLRVYPNGASTPNASALNYVAHKAVANFDTVQLPSNGKIDIYSDGASVDVLIDVVGYYTSTSGYTAQAPARIVDTRNGIGSPKPTGPLAAGHVDAFAVAGQGGVPATGATAVAMTVTAVAPNAVGNLRVFPDQGTATPKIPTTSNINYIVGQTTAAFVIMQVPSNGKIDFYSDNATIALDVDVVGYFSGSAAKVVTQTPVRIFDSRPSPIAANTVVPVTVAGKGNVPANAESVLLQVTSIGPSTGVGNLRVFPGDQSTAPTVSTINYNGGAAIANFVLVRLASNGTVNFYSDGSKVNIAVDVAGWFPNGS